MDRCGGHESVENKINLLLGCKYIINIFIIYGEDRK